MTNEKKKILTREQFIKGSLAGLVLAGGAGSLLSGCSETADSPPTNDNNSGIAAAAWPFTYKKLDPDKAEEIAFQSYLDGNG